MNVNEYLEGLTVYNEPIRQSTIKVALGCQRYFLFCYRWRLFPKGEPYKPAAGLGTIFHRLMDLGPMAISVVESEVKAKQTELADRIRKGEDLTGDMARTMNKMTELYNKALMMAHMVWDKYPEDTLEVVCREQKICLEFRGIGQISGTIDKLVKLSSGGYWIRDYKTSSRDCRYMMAGYKWGAQLRIYRLLADAYLRSLGKEGTTGFILDVVQSPTIKFCKKDVDFEAYLERCSQWYAENDKQAISSAAYMFSEPELSRELLKALSYVAELYNKPADIDRYSKDITGRYCTQYEKVCPYFDLCNMSPDGWPGLLSQYYEVKPPEPEDDNVLLLEEEGSIPLE